MEKEAEPLRPFAVLVELAVDAGSQCSETAFGIIMKLCLHAEAMPAFGPRFRPFLEPEHPDVEGASPLAHTRAVGVGLRVPLNAHLRTSSGFARAESRACIVRGLHHGPAVAVGVLVHWPTL